MKNDSIKENRVLLYTSFFIGIMLVSLVLIWDNNKGKEIERGTKKLYYEEMSGLISSISQNRGTIKVKLKGKEGNPYYMDVTRNYNLKPYNLDDFVQVGDSVYKAANSMRLYVYRGESRYHFIIGERINKK